MGKMRMGILGDFRNKIGTVVGQRWRAGMYTTRAYVKDVRNPKTQAQQLQRAKFATAGELGSAMLAAIDRGFANVLAKKPTTAVGLFVQLNKAAIHANSPDSVTVDYADLILAKGSLTGVIFGAPHFDTPDTVEVSFDANDGTYKAGGDDKVRIAVYCPDAKAMVVSDVAKREDHTISTTVPSSWNGMKVHVWGFVEGNTPDMNNVGLMSNSVYVGTGTIG